MIPFKIVAFYKNRAYEPLLYQVLRPITLFIKSFWLYIALILIFAPHKASNHESNGSFTAGKRHPYFF
jgi:uncharacterized membrane protein